MYPRLLNHFKSHTFFLFGARATDKTRLLRAHFEGKVALWIDLLSNKDFLRYSKEPGLLYDRCTQEVSDAKDGQLLWIVIDEVQKVPALLNEVHRVLEASFAEDAQGKKRICFALTGSSARKIKRGGANMLARIIHEPSTAMTDLLESAL